MLGLDTESEPVFGWKARVPLKNGRFDRTEVDMRWGDLLVEAKLTENDFQIREASLVETYRDLNEVFDLDLLPRVPMRTRRRRDAIELTEDFTQEWEAPSESAEEIAREFAPPSKRAPMPNSVAPRLRRLSAHPQRTGRARCGCSLLRDPRRAPTRSP